MQQDFESGQPASPKGNNVWKWVAIGCGGCLGISVLGVVALGFFASRMMNFSVNSDDVQTEAQKVFDYQLPGESVGLLKMSIMGIEVIQVANDTQPPTVTLTVGRLPQMLQEESAKESFFESFQQSMADDSGYRFSDRRTEETTLCDQPVTLWIEAGSFSTSDGDRPAVSYMTTVSYEGSERFAWILANGETAQDTAQSVFDSLKCQ